jgi:hypothetical protein
MAVLGLPLSPSQRVTLEWQEHGRTIQLAEVHVG